VNNSSPPVVAYGCCQCVIIQHEVHFLYDVNEKGDLSASCAAGVQTRGLEMIDAAAAAAAAAAVVAASENALIL
jgi:hypothetical protein